MLWFLYLRTYCTLLGTFIRRLTLSNFVSLSVYIIPKGFFWGDGGAGHASGYQKGAAEEQLRGCLNYKPCRPSSNPLKTRRGP